MQALMRTSGGHDMLAECSTTLYRPLRRLQSASTATSTAWHGFSSCRHQQHQRSSTSAKLSVVFDLIFLQLQIFSSIVSDFPCLRDLRRPTLHALSVLPTPPLDMLEGLALPTRRSPDLRVQIFYLVLCSPPPRHARGLDHANLRVARPVGSYFSYVFFL
jgi:hypothetical protein